MKVSKIFEKYREMYGENAPSVSQLKAASAYLEGLYDGGSKAKRIKGVSFLLSDMATFMNYLEERSERDKS